MADQNDQATEAPEAVEAQATVIEEPVVEAPATEPEPAPAPTLAPGGETHGTGRRKASVARVRIKPGSGKYVINKREVDTYFTRVVDRSDAVAPLEVTKTAGALDVVVRVRGGGPTGQAGAVRLGLARALKKYDPSFDEALRESGFLTVDARRVERKKYGQPGARRRFQFSKR